MFDFKRNTVIRSPKKVEDPAILDFEIPGSRPENPGFHKDRSSPRTKVMRRSKDVGVLKSPDRDAVLAGIAQLAVEKSFKLKEPNLKKM